jgi:hypothetical protein
MEMDDDFDMQNPLTIPSLVYAIYVYMLKLPVFTGNSNMQTQVQEHMSVTAVTCSVK